MAIKFDTFTQSGGGAGSDTLNDVTSRGASTTNAITVGGLSVGSAYTMPTSDGTANQVLKTDGSGAISFTTLNITGGLEYKGAFNATAGTPSIASALQGDFYIIDTAGTIYGQTWAVGDHLLINADMGGSVTNSKIDKIDNTDAVSSVNGQVGAVSLAVNDLSDVTITAATSGEVLKYNGSAWVDASVAYSEVTGTPTNISAFTNDSGYLTTITGESINDLSDVTITSATTGQVISYNGSAWVNSAASSGSLAGLSDVTITAAASGEVLKYNGSAWVDASVAYSEVTGTPTNISTFTNDSGYLTTITGESINDLSDVTITSATSGQVISYNGSAWVNSAGSAGSLAGLSDVTITAATSGEVLKYNGSAWVDASVAYSEVTGTPTNISAFTNDSGYLTTITGESINDLSDVTITAPTNSEYLRYNGSAWVDASLGIVDDTTPSLGGDLDTNGNAITSASNADVYINPHGTGEISIGADVVPDADVTHTMGSEDYRYISTYSDLNGAIRFKAKNNQGSTLTKGQVVFISGVSGTVPEVQLARANSASTMPAFGLVQANANDQAEVQIITFGNLTDYDTTTHSLSANDTVYVSSATAGALTNTAPTGEANFIQNIGRVVRADASAGIIKVGGAGRSNATPNLDSNKMFLGNGSNQAVSTALSSVALSSFNNDLTIPTAINDLSDVTITSATSGQVISYNGSAWVNSAASGGGGGFTYSAITSLVTAQAEYYYSCDGTFTVTLPAASGVTAGKEIRIKNMGTGTITIARSSTDTIDGQTSAALGVQYQMLSFISNGVDGYEVI